MDERVSPPFAISMGLLELGTGAVLFAVGMRARDGTLRRNRWIGYRTPITLRSDEHWNVAQKAGARQMLASAAPVSVAGAVTLARPPMWVASTCSFIATLAMGIAILWGVHRAITAANAYDGQHRT
jgi:uncharacterized membrane protein